MNLYLHNCYHSGDTNQYSFLTLFCKCFIIIFKLLYLIIYNIPLNGEIIIYLVGVFKCFIVFAIIYEFVKNISINEGLFISIRFLL